MGLASRTDSIYEIYYHSFESSLDKLPNNLPIFKTFM